MAVNATPRARAERSGPRLARAIRRLQRRYDAQRFLKANGESPFRVLVACLLSLRTKDEVSFPATQRLFARASTPEAMSRLEPTTIEKLIYPVGFYRTKARRIRELCRALIRRYRGRVPDDLESLLELPGVGRKTANLVLTLGYGKPGICVDTHVHRISNRLGWVRTRHPHATEMALRKVLPRRHWIAVNGLLVRHGQEICKPLSPLCSRCFLQDLCPRRGVSRSR